jgi:probable F420-dependent oxidoreductase
MRCGISSPIVALSGRRSDWERAAGPAELRQVATAADRLGFDFMTCGEHVAVPDGLYRGARFYDPLATFAWIAAVTERIRFLPHVLVLPFHHPLALAKSYGTLDHLSGGRVILGLGVGNLEEEFAALDVPFRDRGARADDAVPALRAALSGRVVSYSGTHYRFTDLVVEPHAVQQRLPIWIGGHSGPALRRAVAHGDGWAPQPVEYGGPGLADLRRILAEAGAPEGFDVVVQPADPLDPLREPDRVRAVLAEHEDAGGTVFRVAVVHDSLEHYLDQLRAFAEVAGLPAAG